MDTKNKISYINTAEALLDLCAQLANEQWLALDTEFLRESTYLPQFCLLQIGTPEITACVDPLAIDNLDPLFDLLYSPKITKVFHSARQDLEIFYDLRGAIPTPLFDTQIAAPLLGYGEQIGYAPLVTEILNVSLKKAHTRTDWSHRPLKQEQLNYAADDVIYLCQVYQFMHDRLTSLGRLHWLDDEFNALSNSELYVVEPESAWKRIRAASRLRGAQLSTLQALACWREITARADNKPRGWLLKDNALVDLARAAPASIEDLKLIRSLHDSSRRHYGSALLEIIKKAKQKQPEKNDQKNKPHTKSAHREALIDLLMAVVRLRAIEHSLNPSALASRKDLELLILGDSESILLEAWRKKIVGTELLDILQGRKKLSVSDNKIQIEDI